MNKILKNLQLTFGETASSPKVLTIASVNTLIKAIEDPEVNTKFSGHITSETGSINAAQAYTLSLAGLTFHGNVDPVDFTLKANITTIPDNSEVIFSTTGVPVSAIDFIIDSITIDSGSLSVEDVNNICSIENNKLIVGPAGVTFDWQATIKIKAATKYTPATEKTISILVKHKAYSSIVNQTSVNFDTPNTINIPLSFLPVDANTPIESIYATLENISAVYQVGVSGNNVVVTCNSIDDLILNKINIKSIDVAGKSLTSSIYISNKVTTTPKIISEDSFVAKNGKGSLQCTFGFTPEKYNVDVEFISVTSSNSLVSITNASINGFTLNTTDVTTDTSTVITAKIKVDGVEQTITKTINIVYQQIFNEFKVYANSAWVVPTSNVEVKVGDVPTTYIGDGLWLVDESLVDESMDVTAGGVVLGKYGKNEYSDGSEITEFEIFCSNYPSEGHIDISRFVGKEIIRIEAYATNYRLIISNDDASINAAINANLFDNTVWNSTTLSKFKSKKIERQWLNWQSFGSSLYLYLPDETFNPFTPDLSLPSTYLIAKNGTLNELITPTTPNTDVVLTGVNSSNTAITAAIEDNKIKLTGEIADGNPQTSKLTIYYTVNGYSRSVEVDIDATYQEVEKEYEAIDLGLPSGIRWANRNVGAKKPEDNGLYFQWGATTGHKEGEGYNFSSNNYPENGIFADLSLAQDAANANMGGDWRMPTNTEFEELYNNTNVTWTTINGVAGCKFANKTDASKYIFMPAAGNYSGSSLNGWGSDGLYWSSSFFYASSAYYFYFYSNYPSTGKNSRYYGYSVRGVL